MTSEQAAFLRDVFLGSYGMEAGTAKKVIANVPEDKSDYRPDAKSMTAKELAWHIPSTEMFFLSGIAAGEFKMDGEPGMPAGVSTIADISAWYDKTIPALLDGVKAMSGDVLAQDLSFFGMMSMPRVSYLSLMNHHSVHHRGQLSAYLRPMGAKVPSIYGPSADEPMR